MENLSGDCTDVGKLNYIKFCKNLESILIYAKSSQEVITGINDVFVKLRRLVNNYSQVKFHFKICDDREFQRKFFEDVCSILNSFNSKFSVGNFHNSMSKTSLEKYKNMTLGEQLYDVLYGKLWKFDYNCNGGNCTKYTVSFFNFFDVLRKAGLNLGLSIYRLKNIDDNFLGMMGRRHSGLLINFQGKDYMLDYRGLNEEFSRDISPSPVIQSVDDLLHSVKTSESLRSLGVTDFDNLDCFRVKKCEKNISREDEDSLFVYFDNVEDFLKDVEKYPSPKRVSLVEKNKDGISSRFSYWFLRGGIWIEINDDEKMYFLKENVKFENNSEKFFENFVENIMGFQDSNGNEFGFSKDDKERLLWLLNKIRNDIDLDSLVSAYSS